MEINQLRFFQRIAVLEHMTRAAAELQVAQPALSKTIRQLETELGYPLFDRMGKNIFLNENGRILLRYANNILSELEDARIEIQEANKRKENEVVLSIQAASQLLPDIITGFRKMHPNIRISIMQSSGAWHKWDVCIRSARQNRPLPNSKTVLKESILLALPANHRLAGRESVKLEEVADEGFLALQKGQQLREITDEYCFMAGFTPKVVLESDNPSTIRELLKMGIGVFLIPERTWKVQTGEHIRLVRLSSPSCKRYLSIVTQDRSYQPRAVALFQEYLEDFFSRLQHSGEEESKSLQ